ncbi:glycoside hydrolase family 3 protein [Brevibacillus choshinensis]|uniref:beta-N-acetylhexosaminidase n=1 Tax=Brevibacillus choshinensis TaxID=54911 RepID=A0ABX7FWI1_BRECH|nr:glycoside hydrolase family 3 protein [Brevibacillus choshinensis]QRG70044.1 glycoside hydrolase family 3 C-terminal domain-containing protein [Brevibacillus choshinensis]
MRVGRKKVSVVLFVLALLLSQSFFSQGVLKTDAQEQTEVVDLIISLNTPEAELGVTGDTLQLQALHVYRDGHFEKASKGLTWKTSNKNVASVDEQGTVQFANHPGRTFISVTDGTFEDRIAFDYKDRGEQKVTVSKQKGERYQIIDKAISGMTLEEKVGQMMMPDFRKWNGKDVTSMLPEIEALVKKYKVGGVILFRENVVNTEQTIRLVHDYQLAAQKYGLMVTIDQEGGIVTRLQQGTDMPGNMALGATRSEELAFKVGDVIGRELAALGINTNFAPDMDVNNNPDNPVIGVRSFGGDPQLVSDLGVAYIKGLQQNGIAATAKHFPGHGDTAVDSHLGLPEVPHDKDRLSKVELYPFQKAMEAGVDAIMTAHVTFPKIDDTKVISKKDGTEIALPATLSQKVITGLIRDELGFDGVVSTDAMNMQAIADHFGPVDAAIRAVKAGVDIVLMPIGLEEVTTGVLQAVKNGEISEERIEQSVKRILTLKVKRGIFKAENPEGVDGQIERGKSVIGSAENKQVEAEAAARSVTMVKNSGVLPLKLEEDKKIVVIGTTYVDNLAGAVKKHHANTSTIQIATEALSDEQRKQVEEADAVIIGSYTFDVKGRSPENALMSIYNQLIQNNDKPVIGVGIRNPYDIMAYPEVDAYLAQYGFRNASFSATADILFGKSKPTGKLPVTIPDGKGGALYEYGYGLSYEP